MDDRDRSLIAMLRENARAPTALPSTFAPTRSAVPQSMIVSIRPGATPIPIARST